VAEVSACVRTEVKEASVADDRRGDIRGRHYISYNCALRRHLNHTATLLLCRLYHIYKNYIFLLPNIWRKVQ
jgi:hypothetical protein